MAYTQEHLAALQAAISKGVTKLKMGDEEIHYRSLDEMQRIEAKMKAELSGERRRGIVYPTTKTGWR